MANPVQFFGKRLNSKALKDQPGWEIKTWRDLRAPMVQEQRAYPSCLKHQWCRAAFPSRHTDLKDWLQSHSIAWCSSGSLFRQTASQEFAGAKARPDQFSQRPRFTSPWAHFKTWGLNKRNLWPQNLTLAQTIRSRQVNCLKNRPTEGARIQSKFLECLWWRNKKASRWAGSSAQLEQKQGVTSCRTRPKNDTN